MATAQEGHQDGATAPTAVLGGGNNDLKDMPMSNGDTAPSSGLLFGEGPRQGTPKPRTAWWQILAVIAGLVVLVGASVFLFLPPHDPSASPGATPTPAPWASLSGITDSPAAFSQWCYARIKAGQDAVQAAKAAPDAPLAWLNSADVALGNAGSMASVMANAHPDPAIRDAAEACTGVLQNYTTGLSFDEDLAQLMLALQGAPAFAGVTGASDAVNNTAALALRYVDDSVRGFRTQGVLPPPPGRTGGGGVPVDTLKAMSAQMLDLGLAFEREVAEDIRSLRIPASAVPVKCAGIPADFLASRTAAALGLPTDVGAGQTPEDVVLDTTYPSYFPVMQYGSHRGLRGEMFGLFNTRGTPGNLQRLARILQLRWDYARALGFANWAELQLADKMQGNPANTTAFLDRVHAALAPAAAADGQALQGLLDADLAANATGGEESPALQAFDSAFYLNRLKEQEYQVDPDRVREYFTYNDARRGVLATASAVFGVRFEVVAPVWGVDYGRGGESEEEFNVWAQGVANANGGVTRWHSSVEVLNVYSTRPSALAGSWAQVQPNDRSVGGGPTLSDACAGYVQGGGGDAGGMRDEAAGLAPGMGGAWRVAEGGATAPPNPPACYMGAGEVLGRVYLDMWPRAGKYQHAAQFDLRAGVAGVQAAEGTLLTNFPASGSMEHSQVVTFFHEFGHLMHHVVGGTNSVFQAYSGVATEWDFVEAPSQMLEAWAWDTGVLQAFAVSEGGNPIPQGLVSAMVEASAAGRGIGNKQQVFYAQLSLGLHMTDPAAFADDASGGTGNATILHFLQSTQAAWSPYPYVPGTNFAASFGHLIGYGAIYSTYLWSNVIARDMLSVFTDSPFGLLDTLSAGQYTNRIIASGGRGDALALLDSFLGRPVDFAPFAAWVSSTVR